MGELLMTDDELERFAPPPLKTDDLRELAETMTRAAASVALSAQSIAESAHNLMDLINRTQADAAKMIAGQLKRSQYVAEKLEEMREAGGPTDVGQKIRTSDGRLIEIPAGRPDAEDHAP